MSATTEPKREKKYSPLLHHVSQPYGMLVIGGVLFTAAWFSWNYWLALSIVH